MISSIVFHGRKTIGALHLSVGLAGRLMKLKNLQLSSGRTRPLLDFIKRRSRLESVFSRAKRDQLCICNEISSKFVTNERLGQRGQVCETIEPACRPAGTCRPGAPALDCRHFQRPRLRAALSSEEAHSAELQTWPGKAGTRHQPGTKGRAARLVQKTRDGTSVWPDSQSCWPSFSSETRANSSSIDARRGREQTCFSWGPALEQEMRA